MNSQAVSQNARRGGKSHRHIPVCVVSVCLCTNMCAHVSVGVCVCVCVCARACVHNYKVATVLCVLCSVVVIP